ncbi:MAG: HD domain-containing protein [Lachnospiraceae bacterium]|nr:HD domain-containing protein [Lachnospiraceae bacterium]
MKGRGLVRERIRRWLAGTVAVLLAGLLLLPVNSLADNGGDGTEKAAGRKITVDPTGRSEGSAAILYDNTNGLPTSEANAIAQTAEGFLWIGSYSGLIRYDGNTFDRIDSTTGIASVVSLFVDSSDKLWIGTNDSGVYVQHQGREWHFGKSEGLKSASVRSITQDDNGNVYVATTHGIAMVDQSMRMRAMDAPQVNDEYIRMLRKGADGLIYGLTQEGAIFTMKDGAVTGFFEGAKMGIMDIHAILPDPAKPGYLYVGTEGSKVYYGNLDDGMNSPRVISVLPLSCVNDIQCFQEQVWVCTDDGVGIIENGRCQKLENIPLRNSVEHVITDYQGNLWFTSSRQGVMKIVPDQFMDIFERYDLADEVVNTTCYLNGRLFVGTDRGLMALDPKLIVTKIPLKQAVTASGKDTYQTDLIKMLEDVRIRSIVRDSQDRLWISTYSEYGLIRYSEGKVLCYTMADGMPSNRIRVVVEKADGTMMVACTGGVATILGNKITEVYNEASGISNTEILTVAEGKHHDVIIGTDGDGIYVCSGTKTTPIGTENGLSSGVVMRIKKSKYRDVYWVVTSNSIAYMTEDYKIVTIQKFPYSNNFDVVENSKGDLWILSSNGIYVTSVEDVMENEEISCLYYSKANGLSCVNTANSYSDISDDGDLYIAGSTGVVRVNIEREFEDVNSVKLAVPYVEADGVRIFPDKNGSFTISSKTKKLTIYGYAYVYTLMNPKVTYYLKGFDRDRTTVERSEFGAVDYTNLRGGTYTFVMNLEDDSGQNGTELAVQIVKTKAVYEQWWFLLLSVLLIILIIAEIVIRYVQKKTKALLKKQEEDKLLIREITEAFAMTIDMKDRYTRGHSTRVAEYTVMLAKELGYDEETVEKFRNIALLHDIGKIGVPPEVLNKQGKLTDQEFGVIKSHSALGYEALRKISIMPELAVGARSHHERPDGKGYPQGLTGVDIPRVAQIIAVADTFDAMYSDRPYRKRMNFDKVVSIIKEVSGTQLTADVVDAFLRLVEKGEFRDPNDDGGGSTEDIDNIHKKQNEESK